MEPIFTNIYEGKHWGNNNNPAYNGSSGDGSSVEYNRLTYAPLLRTFIKMNKIKSVVDCGCGDWRSGEILYGGLGLDYLGLDTYKKVIEHNQTEHPDYKFQHMDFYTQKEEIPAADLLILKDVIQHWKTEEIYSFLDYLTTVKKHKYILMVNCSYQKEDDQPIPPSVEGTYRFRPLSANFLPLKKYNPNILFTYHTKEASVIETAADTA